MRTSFDGFIRHNQQLAIFFEFIHGVGRSPTLVCCLDFKKDFIAMDIDRNRYFMFGVILFLLGLQFRLVDSFVLNENSTRALHRLVQKANIADSNIATNVYMQVASSPKKNLRPPNWLGFVLLTVGGVMSLHAMVLPRRQ